MGDSRQSPPMTIDMPAGACDASNPLVSVIVRSMDRPSLHDALASVLLQDWRPLELVIVNASGQPHSALPMTSADVAIRLVPDTPVPLARAAAANLGLSAACGESVIFLDDDDLFLPGHLSKLVAALQASPDMVAVYADVELGRFNGPHWQARHCFAADFDRQRLLFENYLPMHAVLFRRAATQRGDGACRFDERLDLFEDWDFWLQLCERAPMLRVPGISARYVADAQGGSGVFEESSAAAAARALLYGKWQQRMTAEAYADFMRYAQSQFRAKADLGDRLADVQRAGQSLAETAQALRSTLQARDSEIASHVAQARDLRQLVAAREADIANAATMIANLQAVLAARETELVDWAAEMASVRAALAQQQATVAALLAEGPMTALKRTLKRSLKRIQERTPSGR